MSLSTTDFWKLAVESQLLTPDQCQSLGRKFAQGNGAAAAADAAALAEWLIGERTISRYHAKVLLARRAGPFVYGDYQVTDRIDEGRLKGVFRAIHLPTRHSVSLSFLAAGMVQDRERLARITARAAAAAKASHPCLWRCYHLVDLPKYKFVAAADHPGKTLDELLPARKTPPPPEACRIIRQVALALVELHAKGQPHGDLRPANVWLTPSGTVKLLHFPFVLEPPLPAPAGVPDELTDYLAPELASGGRPPDERGDLYALGCLLYQLLTGRAPFDGGDARQKLHRHATETPAALDRLNASIPKTLAQVVGYLLAKDPAQRYQKAAIVVEALLPYVPAQQASIAADPATPQGNAYGAWLAELRNQKPSGAMVQPVSMVQPAGAFPKAAPVQPAGAASTAALPRAMPTPPVAQAVVAGVPAGLPVGQPIAGGAFPVAQAVAAPAGLPVAQAMQPGMMGPAVAVAAPYPTAGFHQAAAIPDYSAVPVVTAPSLGVAAERRVGSKRRRSNALFLVGCVAVLVATIVGLAIWGPSLLEDDTPVAQQPTTNGSSDGGQSPADEVKPPDQVAVVEEPPVDPSVELLLPADDPVWRSPTKGQALDLRYFPAGVQVYIALRPAEILKHDEGEKVLTGLGPLGDMARESLRTMGGTPPENIELAIFGLRDGGPGNPPQVALVVRTLEAVTEQDMLTAWGNPAEEDFEGRKVYKNQGLAFFAPAEGKGKVLVAWPLEAQEVLKETLAKVDDPPNLLTPFESLRKASDADRQFTMLFSPHFLLTSGGRSLFEGAAEKLHDPLDGFLADDQGKAPPAVMFSAHLGDDLFLEMRAYTAAGEAPLVVAKTYRDRVRAFDKNVGNYLSEINLHAYGRKILFQFPRMLEQVGEFSVAAADDKQALIRCYLPLVAAHNLALASRLAVTERGGGGAVGPVAVAPKPKTLRERLQEKTSYKIPRSPLDVVVAALGETLGTEIVLMGKDMQMEGITKNQQVDLEVEDKTYAEILQAILLKANKDDKLVYVFAEKDGKEILNVTTRAAAQSRKDEVPPEFQR